MLHTKSMYKSLKDLSQNNKAPGIFYYLIIIMVSSFFSIFFIMFLL